MIAIQPNQPVSGSAGSFLFDGPVPSSLRVCVVVPVRNEAHHLKQTLDALRLQLATDGRPLPAGTYEVLLLANNCTDRSAEVARRYRRAHPRFALHVACITLPPPQANIGYVRRVLMDEACRRLTLAGHPRGIIASTDGDTVVDRYWIAQTIREIDQGCDAVGGRILTHPVASRPDALRLFHLRDVTYRCLVAQLEAAIDPCPHDPFPRHFQHFGASLAVTYEAYQRAGRLPAVRFLEDEALYRALLRIDAKVRKSPAVRVYTSMRTNGRAEVGFSWMLRQWSDMNRRHETPLAEPAGAVLLRLRNRARLRHCWATRFAQTHQRTLLLIARDLGVDYRWLCRELLSSAYFGQLWERVEEQMQRGPWPRRWPPVPITRSISRLRALLRRIGRQPEPKTCLTQA